MRARTGPPSIIAVKLDPIGAVSDLVTHHANQAIHAVGLFRALRNTPLQRIAFGRVATSRHDRTRGSQYPRPRDYPLVHGLLQFHVGVSGAFGSQVRMVVKPAISVARR